MKKNILLVDDIHDHQIGSFLLDGLDGGFAIFRNLNYVIFFFELQFQNRQ